MGASDFRSSLSEDAGVRSGFALAEAEMLAHLPDDHPLRASLEANAVLRVGADTYADTVGDLLFAFGVAEEPGMPSLSQRFVRRLDRSWQDLFGPDQLMTIEAVASAYLRAKNKGRPEQSALLDELRELLGSRAGQAWDLLIEAMEVHLAQCPYFTRSAKADELVKLTDLFHSEMLPADERTFFDQRFINYLASRPEKLPHIHWRQFEGLAAEWFAREGYLVELGPGRNDGSIDLRLWRGEKSDGAPPAVIVQCKRQKRKIERIVVKALYADILDERAESGLIVTTSDISPGAARDVHARAYPVTTANRAQVVAWIAAMRRPYAGVIIG